MPFTDYGLATIYANYVPVSRELLEDVYDITVPIERELLLYFTAASFGENWHSARGEMERLELGMAIRWDMREWDEDEDD